jgi:hypothetical protein
MPTIKEWTELHADLMQRLHLPCELNFSTDVKVAQHRFDDDDTCVITINPEVDFKVPVHLILHEAAHHRAYVRAFRHLTDNTFVDLCCSGWTGGHCEHWAKILIGMYAEMGIALPYSTSFIAFAKLAGIVRKNYAREGQWNGQRNNGAG